jgi:hypothetical protein
MQAARLTDRERSRSFILDAACQSLAEQLPSSSVRVAFATSLVSDLSTSHWLTMKEARDCIPPRPVQWVNDQLGPGVIVPAGSKGKSSTGQPCSRHE